jgi:hypothetical protein
MRAMRRIDQLRRIQKDAVGLNSGAVSGGEKDGHARPTLASQGIDKNLAKQARALGSLSDERFERATSLTRANGFRRRV